MGTSHRRFVRGLLARMKAGTAGRAGAHPVVPALTALVAWVTLSCATNPATGERQIMLVSESQEIQIGREGAEETVQAIPPVGDSTLQRYVRGIGLEMATSSERPDLPWSFVALDDGTVNAFAYPGGFIFVTRGILTHMNSEAELAAVLGHEIGHVTARHSASQISKAQLASAGLIVGSIVSPVVRDLSGVAQAGLGLLFLKYSRDAEHQADELGLRYMVREGWDPRAMTEMFQMLIRTSARHAAGRLPEWQSTHPHPENRIEQTQQLISQLQRDLSGLTVDREEFVRRIDGMIFGENPRHGYFEENRFLHPDFRFRFEFPKGWRTQNQPTAVVAQSPNQDALLALSFAQASSPTDAMRQFMGQEGITPGQTSGGNINSFPAAWGEFQARTNEGTLAGQVAYLQDGSRLYQILGYSTSASYRQYAGPFQTAIRSFDRLTDPAALNKQPVRVHMVRISRAMTIAEFNRAYPSTIDLEYLAAINAVEPTERIAAGAWVKQIK